MAYEMKGDYTNFDEHREEDQEAETSFIDRDATRDEESDENTDFKQSTSKKLPVSFEDKKNFIKKYFRDSVYNDSSSRIFLSNIEFKDSATADNEMEILYKGIEIGEFDLDTKTLTRNMDNIRLSGYDKDHRDIINYRNTTLIGQIEETTGDPDHDINQMIAENIRKKFVIEIQKREGLKNPGEHIEMVQLNEDYNRLQRGKKLETDLGREILDGQVNNTRRILEFKKFMGLVPGVGFLFVSVMGVFTAIVLLGKGLTYDASSSVQPKKKKSSSSKDDSFDPIREAQKIASQILETSGDYFEILVTVATVSYFVYRRRKK